MKLEFRDAELSTIKDALVDRYARCLANAEELERILDRYGLADEDRFAVASVRRQAAVTAAVLTRHFAWAPPVEAW